MRTRNSKGFTAIDSRYGHTHAVECDVKGGRSKIATKTLIEFCRSLVFEKFHLQGDPENAIQEVITKVAEAVPGAMPRSTPKNSKESNGKVGSIRPTKGTWRPWGL